MDHRLNPRAPEFIPQNHNSQAQTIPAFQNAPQIYFYPPFSYTSQPLIPFLPPPPPPQILTVDHHHINGHDQTAVVSQPPQRFITNPSGKTRASYVGDRARNFNNILPRQQRNNYNGNNYNNNNKRVFNRSSYDGKSKMVYVKKAECSSTSHRQRRSSNLYVDSENVTTLMIRNIPSKYTRRMLMEFVDEHCKVQNSNNVHHAYDFLYLPIDFRSKLNKGYGFVNFTSPEASSAFAEKTNNQKWPFFNSSKIREISSARLQGKDVMMRNYENMRFACKEAEFLPVLFKPARDGSNQDLVTEQIIGIYYGEFS